MISLTSEMTDRKSRHARGWLFYDAECKFCTRLARWLIRPLHKRGMAVAPLQDPRVAALLGLSREELLRAIRLVMSDGQRYAGAEVLVALACELWWLRPLAWIAKVPRGSSFLRWMYDGVARRRKCRSARPQFSTQASAGGSCI